MNTNTNASEGAVGVALLLRDGIPLGLRCCHPTCLRGVLMFPAEAASRFGAKATFPAISKRAICSKCGGRGRDGFITASLHQVDVQARAQAIWEAGQLAASGKVPQGGRMDTMHMPWIRDELG